MANDLKVNEKRQYFCVASAAEATQSTYDVSGSFLFVCLFVCLTVCSVTSHSRLSQVGQWLFLI